MTNFCKYYHPLEIFSIMVCLFFMISKILSCKKRALEMKILNSSSLYHPTISTWTKRVLQGMPNSISNRTLEDLHESEPMNYGSMMYVYGWMMEKHQPIGIDYQLIRDDDYVH